MKKSGKGLSNIKITALVNQMILNSQMAMQTEVNEQREVYSLAKVNAVAAAGLATVTNIAVFFIILTQVVNPLKKTSSKLNNIIEGINNGQGDLTERVEERGKDEIGQLAENSKNTANNIQYINELVTVAVKELIKNSNELVDYINNNVLPDYDSLVASGKQYNEDAMHVNDVVGQFNVMSGELSSLVKSITDAIDGISTAVEESANGVSTAAMNTGELVRDINQISDEMDSNHEVANKLKKETEIFVNL